MLLTVPVDPDAETARQWAIDELNGSAYQEQTPSWFDRFLAWVGDLFSNPLDLGGGDGVVKGIVVLLIVALLIYLVIRLTAGPVRRAMNARRAHSVFDDDNRTSVAMRASADAAAAAGNWALAVLERFRAIVRSLEERDLLEDLPGVTADEAARATGLRFPDTLLSMARAAETFDGVRYGHAMVGPDDDAALRALDATLAPRSLLRTTAP